MDRFIATALFGAALLAGGSAFLMLLNGFIEYLQVGAWHATSVLQFGYDTGLIQARWFLANDWSWWIHDALSWTPTYALLLGVTPLLWWLSSRIGGR